MFTFLKNLFSSKNTPSPEKLYFWKYHSLQTQCCFIGFGRHGAYYESELPKGCDDFDSYEKDYGIMFDLQKFVDGLKEKMIEESEHILIPDKVKHYLINRKLDHALSCIRFTRSLGGPEIERDLSNIDVGYLNIIKYHQVIENGSLLTDYGGTRDFYPEISKHMMNIDGYDSFRLWVALTVCQEVNEYLKMYPEICKSVRCP